MVWDPSKRAAWLRYGAAVLIPLAAAALRLQFLGMLELRVTFLTFYPAVAVAALYGGAGSGVLAAVVSAALANYFWMVPVGRFALTNVADLVSMAVFLFSCTLIASLAEATSRAQTRALRADEESKLAAERERVTLDFQRSKEKYRELVQNANSAILRWKSDGTITFFNEYAQQLFGYSGEEIIGKHVGILVPGQESTGTDLRELVQTIVNFPHNYSQNINENILRDGRRIWMAWTNRPILDPEGKVAEILAVGSDITERIRAEQALHESEVRFRLLSRTADRLLVSDDPHGIVDELCHEIMENLDCQVFFNFLADEEAGRLRLNSCAGIPQEETKKIQWLDYGVAVCGSVAREERRIVAEEIPRFPDPRTELVKSYGIQAYACHPLMARGRLIGTLSFGTKTRARFLPEDLDLMKTVADQVATAIERKRLIAELQQARDNLEVRVRDRTRQLEETNRSLQVEIAERRNAERLLREKNELLEVILSTVHFLIAFLDKDFNFVRVNQAYAAAEERSPEFFIGRNHFELYPNAENQAIFQKVVETKTPHFAVEKAFQYSQHPDRGTSYWDWSLQPVADMSGEVTGLVFCLLDVTERRRAQDALRQSEELLRKVLITLPVGVWITDQDGKISMANPAAERIWGGARFVGLEGYGEYRGWWAETGKPVAAEEWALARAITRGEVSFNEVVDIQCFDGTRKTILNSAAPIRDDHNEIVRAIVVNQDITELRKAESELKHSKEKLRKNAELLQMVFDGISDPLIMLDGAGLVAMINRAAMDYYGVSESMGVVGKPCFQGLRGREAACPECSYPFLTAGRESVTFERKGLNDKVVVEKVTLYPVLGESQRRDGVIVKITDVTQEKILERQILQNEKLASLGLVTSGIAHEINNPNSFIYFNIPILKRYLLELLPVVDDYARLHPDLEVLHMSYAELREDMFRLLENMEHGSHRINKIVGILKGFAQRRDSHGLQQVDLKQLVGKVVALCHAELRRKIKTFEALVPDDLPPVVSDPEALEQILLNLLINAVHAADKEDSKITLKVELGTSEFVLQVTDNGSGMEEAVRERIFDPFFTTKPSELGTGLGLYVCHEHVESLGGRIEVESSVGRGATFRVLLPKEGHEAVLAGPVPRGI